jgi:ABC-type bacteriocin/lantibiotic exporter with double-glycine peptidase domain
MPITSATTPDSSTKTLLLGIWGHMTRRRRIQLSLLLLVMLVTGLAEILSLGAVLPFLAVLSDPQRLWQNQVVQALGIRFGFTSASQLLLPVTLIFALFSMLAAFIRLANLWLNGQLAAAVGSDLSCEAYRRTLYQPYEVHLQRNSAEVITETTNQINLTVFSVRSLLMLITSVVVAACLLICLLLIDASLALISASLFGIAYGLLATMARRRLRRNGLKIAEASTQQLKALQEGLGAIRDVLLDGSQPFYLQIYRQADRPLRISDADNAFITIFPRYSLEALGMVAIALIGGLLVSQRGSGTAVIPLLGAFALGAQRLLPSLQQIYSSWASLNACNAAINAVLTVLNQPVPPQVTVVEPMQLRECFRLERGHFSYGPDQPDVLRGVDVEIFQGERIGLIGSTGSGKSTLVDILMGLLVPTSGRLLVDGVDLHNAAQPERLLSWRASIAHVPQSIYLADSSIAENIAFGVPRQKIDLDRVKEAAAQAQIASFIEASPHRYWTYVGERGIRLSGGQRQRIGIARALYKRTAVLIFDEATSALDTGTEEAVMNSVDSLSKDLTVLMIAHRLSTVARCDRVIQIENGAVQKVHTPFPFNYFSPA